MAAALSFPSSNRTFWPGRNSEDSKGQGLQGRDCCTPPNSKEGRGGRAAAHSPDSFGRGDRTTLGYPRGLAGWTVCIPAPHWPFCPRLCGGIELGTSNQQRAHPPVQLTEHVYVLTPAHTHPLLRQTPSPSCLLRGAQTSGTWGHQQVLAPEPVGAPVSPFLQLQFVSISRPSLPGLSLRSPA